MTHHAGTWCGTSPWPHRRWICANASGACDEGAGAAEAELAVHSDKAWRGVDDAAGAEEGGDRGAGRHWAAACWGGGGGGWRGHNRPRSERRARRGAPRRSWVWGHSTGASKGIVPVSPAGNSVIFPVLIPCESRRELVSAVEKRIWVKNCWVEFESNTVANLLLWIRIWVKYCCKFVTISHFYIDVTNILHYRILSYYSHVWSNFAISHKFANIPRVFNSTFSHFRILHYNSHVWSNFAISHQFRKHTAIIQHFRNHYTFDIISNMIYTEGYNIKLRWIGWCARCFPEKDVSLAINEHHWRRVGNMELGILECQAIKTSQMLRNRKIWRSCWNIRAWAAHGIVQSQDCKNWENVRKGWKAAKVCVFRNSTPKRNLCKNLAFTVKKPLQKPCVHRSAGERYTLSWTQNSSGNPRARIYTP